MFFFVYSIVSPLFIFHASIGVFPNNSFNTSSDDKALMDVPLADVEGSQSSAKWRQVAVRKVSTSHLSQETNSADTLLTLPANARCYQLHRNCYQLHRNR
jgi:hypothetical protein